MKIARWFSILCLLSPTFAQQAPWGRADISVSTSSYRIVMVTVAVLDAAKPSLA